MIKIYGNVQGYSSNDSRALYLRLNDKVADTQSLLDFRIQAGNQGYYARNAIQNSPVYLGDMWAKANSSYIEITLVKGQINNWNTICSRIFSQAGESQTAGGVSLCGGQFAQDLSKITQMWLHYDGALSGTIIIEVYPNSENR